MIKNISEWFKKVWKYFLAGIGVLLAIFLFRRHRKVGDVRDQKAVEKHLTEIDNLNRYRDLVLAQEGETSESIASLDKEIAQNRRAIIEAHEDSQGLTDEEVAAEFARLGY